MVEESGIASQDFRDGVATGSALMAKRLIEIQRYGLPLTISAINAVADAIRYEYGGSVFDFD